MRIERIKKVSSSCQRGQFECVAPGRANSSPWYHQAVTQPIQKRALEANQSPKTLLGALTLDTELVLWLARG